MKLRWFLLPVTVLFALALGGADGADQNRYVGWKRCERCHASADKGKQIATWKQKKHSQAMKVLSTAKAKEVAAKLGVASPTTDKRCLRCHETGYDKKKSQLGKSFKMGEGVQCESCHGPGERHFRVRFEEEQEEDEYEDEEPELMMALPRGELTKITEKTCTECHNKESPTYKPFCFTERLKEMAHWDPRREKVRGKKALSKRTSKCEK
jgi:cytochrome c5